MRWSNPGSSRTSTSAELSDTPAVASQNRQSRRRSLGHPLCARVAASLRLDQRSARTCPAWTSAGRERLRGVHLAVGGQRPRADPHSRRKPAPDSPSARARTRTFTLTRSYTRTRPAPPARPHVQVQRQGLAGVAVERLVDERQYGGSGGRSRAWQETEAPQRYTWQPQMQTCKLNLVLVGLRAPSRRSSAPVSVSRKAHGVKLARASAANATTSASSSQHAAMSCMSRADNRHHSQALDSRAA